MLGFSIRVYGCLITNISDDFFQKPHHQKTALYLAAFIGLARATKAKTRLKNPSREQIL